MTLRSWCLSALTLLLLTTRAVAQCPGDAILDPLGPGANGQTRIQSFYTLVDDLYSEVNVTRRLFFDGKWHQVPPWFSESHVCGEADLHTYPDFPSPPTFNRYLVNGDELSELAVVAALADDEQRMIEIHHAIQVMIAGSAHAGLPCWLAKVENGMLSCFQTDTAADVTARFGLAYYFAAANPGFSSAQRTLFRDAATNLVRRHVDAEYANFNPQVESCPQIAPTGRPICDWAGGGGNTASRGSFQAGGTHMWIGYYQDVVRFLIAAAESEAGRDPALASRALQAADQAVEQWLGASRFDGTTATFGSKEFTWEAAAPPIQPRQVERWEAADAPRALWMGDVLRAIHLHTRGAPLAGSYARLSDWVELVLGGDTQTSTTSCIEYNADGTIPVQSNGQRINCGPGFYYNGLGAGLLTYHQTPWLDDKLDEALSHYRWADKAWDNPSHCFGIYRPIRPLKALAAAIGLDAAAFGTSCPAAQPSCSVPSAPTWLRVSTVSQNRLDLLWQDNSAAEAGFKVERKEGCCGPWTLLSPAAANATTYASTGLQCGTTYAYRAWAFDGGCESAKTNEAAATTAACTLPTVPAAPTWLRVSAASPTQINLLWQDNSTNETGFKVERKEGCCGPWTLLPAAAANATTYNSAGLKCGTSYAYRVWAFNGAGDSVRTNEAATTSQPCP